MCILDKSKIFFLIFILFLTSGAFAHENEDVIDLSHSKTLQGGWYTFEPYLFQTEKNGVKTLEGLDYELMKVISREAKIKVEYKNLPWDDLEDAIKNGKKDFATGVLYSKEREKYFYYSIPYRYSEASLFLSAEKAKLISNKTVPAALDYIKKNNFKVGVVNDYLYSNPEVDKFIKDPRNQSLLVKTDSDTANLDLLLNGEIDGFIADRIVGSHLIWHSNSLKNIKEYRLGNPVPTYIIFSKKTISPDFVEKFNGSIRDIKDSAAYQNIVSWYLYPAIVFQIRSAPWFMITELIGTIAFALSGLLIAFKEKTTLFGAIILAILPSIGGGLIRDIIFGRNPVGALQSPVYLLTVLLTVLIGFIIIKILSYFRKRKKFSREVEDAIFHHAAIILTVTDALGLATFTVVGVMVSLLAKATPLWLWGPFFAFITGAGGGILRDMLSKTRYIEALEGEFYGELAIFWGFLLSLYILLSTNQAEPEYLEYAVVFTIVGVFISRIIVHFMHVPNINFKHLE